MLSRERARGASAGDAPNPLSTVSGAGSPFAVAKDLNGFFMSIEHGIGNITFRFEQTVVVVQRQLVVMSTATLPVVIALIVFAHGAKEKPELSEDIQEIIRHVHNECVGKIGVAEEDITNCENGIFKEDTKLKCYMYCLLEEVSLRVVPLTSFAPMLRSARLAAVDGAHSAQPAAVAYSSEIAHGVRRITPCSLG
ncbi:unnamed protein product, partial [Iphiclides podalirius]